MLMTPVKGAVKAVAEDTMWAEAAYHASGQTFGGNVVATGTNVWENAGNVPSIWLPYGTGWSNNLNGSGEIGCVFDFSYTGWLNQVGGIDVQNRSVTGVIAWMIRYKSSIERINSKDMPLYFKLYTARLGQLTEQEAYDDIVSDNTRCEATIDVHYPVDPDKYASLSNTVYVPFEPEKPEDIDAVGFYGARFETPAKASDYCAISLMFPNEQNDEDTLWNAAVLFFTENGNTLKSEDPGHMYMVYDCRNQHMWGARDGDDFIYARERLTWMLPDSNAQTNEYSVVVPMTSWVFSNGGRLDYESVLRIILADDAAIERGAAYDKYVEVKVNPAIDYTVIAATDKIKNVEIYNMNGKLVKTQACNSNVETISLSGLNSGMYIAKVTTEGGIANKKIMVR